jgi:hypothetical protein
MNQEAALFCVTIPSKLPLRARETVTRSPIAMVLVFFMHCL